MRYQHSKTAGFNLIEILIAVPAFKPKSPSASVVSVPKVVVTESQVSGRGVDFEFSQTRYCGNLQIAENGSIVLQTRNTGASTEPLLQFVPSIAGVSGSSLNCECQLLAGKSTHVPPNCRNDGTMADIGDASANGVSVSGSSSASGNDNDGGPFIKPNGKPDKKKCKDAGYT